MGWVGWIGKIEQDLVKLERRTARWKPASFHRRNPGHSGHDLKIENSLVRERGKPRVGQMILSSVERGIKRARRTEERF